MLEVLKNHVLRYQEAPDLGAYSATYHMIAASLLQSTKGAPQQELATGVAFGGMGLVSSLGLCFMTRPT